MDISIFFQPVNMLESADKHLFVNHFNTHTTASNFPELDDVKIAIIGVNEERGAINNEGCADAPDAVRKQLHQLNHTGQNISIVDLGNIKAGETVEDTYFALAQAVTVLIKKNILPIIIGGSQDLTFGNYKAYQELEQTINLVCIDNKFDLGETNDELHANSYLSKIVLSQPNFLFNYCNLGYQRYFVNEEAIDLMNKLYFDTYRLGNYSNQIQETEPIIRNADMISFDMSAIRMSDAIASDAPTPNGFYAEQACQMMRYAGFSDKLTSIGLYNYNPSKDKQNQTAQLMAQMIWFIIEGVGSRQKDFPMRNKSSYTKYRVMLEDNKYELTFYKSKKTDRWWIDIPYPPNKRIQFDRHHLVPCSYSHYQKALENEVPDVWWSAYQKLV